MTIKRCSTCKEEKLLSEFRKDSSAKCGYQHHCKVCARAYHKSAYMQKYGKKAKARNYNRQVLQKQLVTDYKAERGCILCGEMEPWCLDFHHKDPQQKDFALSTVTTQSTSLIFSEIEKCVVVCKNCHMKIHKELISLL